MNLDQQLKLQSYLDGELSSREAKEVADWAARDTEASALLTELKNMTTALKDNELEIKLPESREFYWSKIQRQIQTEAAKPSVAPAREPVFARFWKMFLPLAGAAAAVIVFAVMTEKQGGLGYVPGVGESSADMAAYRYHSQEDRMTVVWLADNNSSATADSDSSDATELQ